MRAATALPILMYHHVSPNPGLVTVSPAIFRNHMEALAAAGWRTAGLEEAVTFFHGEPLPAKTCIVTFDDAYLDNQVYAAPVLAACGLKAVIFAVTGWMGDGPVREGHQETPDHRECKRRIATGAPDSVILRWSEAERLQSAQIFEFHSHTHTHTRWDKTLPDSAQRETALTGDLTESRQQLEARLGVVSSHLCWPQGYYDDQYILSAKRLGFEYFYTTEPSINRPNSPVNRIGRVVTKEKSGNWLLWRTRLYATPWLGGIYATLRAAK